MKSTDALLVDCFDQRLEFIGIGAEEVRLERGHEHLADLVLERHLLQRRLDPLLPRLVHLERTRRLPCQHSRGQQDKTGNERFQPAHL
jgi:hypothetical protein